MQTKWNKIVPGKFPTLSPRQADAPEFTEVFTSSSPQPISDWPDIDKPSVPQGINDVDFSQLPLNNLQKSFVHGVASLPQAQGLNVDASAIKTHEEAFQFVRSVPNLPGHKTEYSSSILRTVLSEG